jgi:hypothetical protein
MSRILVKDVRLAFAVLWHPEPFPGGKDPTPYYSGSFIMPPTHPQRRELNVLMDTLAAEEWKLRGPAVLKAMKATGKVFFRDGNTKPEYDGFPGNWFISARSKVKPNCFDHKRDNITEEMGILYSGCYVNVLLSTYAYTKGNNGLGAELKGVQFLRKGDAFGGGGPPAQADEFDEIDAPDEEAADADADEMLG